MWICEFCGCPCEPTLEPPCLCRAGGGGCRCVCTAWRWVNSLDDPVEADDFADPDDDPA